MTGDEFELIVEEEYANLPEPFRSAIENVRIVVEEIPGNDVVEKLHLRSPKDLLGLYQGIPLTARGTWYGSHAVLPDTITLYQKNIMARVRTDAELRAAIHDVLIHEIGHYFGMSEEEIRSAGY